MDRTQDPTPTLYTEALAAGLVVGHHCSDLYLRDCVEARRLVAEHGARAFRDMTDGRGCLDVPFAFDPYWKLSPPPSRLKGRSVPPESPRRTPPPRKPDLNRDISKLIAVEYAAETLRELADMLESDRERADG